MGAPVSSSTVTVNVTGDPASAHSGRPVMEIEAGVVCAAPNAPIASARKSAKSDVFPFGTLSVTTPSSPSVPPSLGVVLGTRREARQLRPGGEATTVGPPLAQVSAKVPDRFRQRSRLRTHAAEVFEPIHERGPGERQ